MAVDSDPVLDVLVVGAGFAGLMAGLELARTGRLFAILERGPTVGGVWRDNTYPGCACDIPGDLYSIPGRRNPNWTSTYPKQPEILSYLEHVATESGLDAYLRLGFEVDRLSFDEDAGLWTALAKDGRRVQARAAVLALGPQSRPKMPQIQGLEGFQGQIVHTAQWPKDLELTGKRVGILGTGASAVQIVPAIAPIVDTLTVFQRTAAWILPRMDRPYGPWMQRLRARYPVVQSVSRACSYGVHEVFGLAFMGFGMLNRTLRAVAQVKLQRAVRDPALRRRLTPDYALGCKRVMVADDYWVAFSRPNVVLETAAIARATAEGLETATRTRHALDVLICATGFSVADPDGYLRIEGLRGRVLEDDWRVNGAHAYRGTVLPGFPNLMMLLGPNSGLGHSSALLTIESQLRYVLGYLDRLDCMPKGSALDVRPEVETAWNTEIQRRLKRTIWASGCESWYMDRNGRNVTIFPGLTRAFRQATKSFDATTFMTLPPQGAGGQFRQKRDMMQSSKICAPPEVPRLQALLESGRMRRDPLDTFHGHQRRLGDDYVYHFGGMKRVRVVSDPTILRRVLKDNADNYRKSEIQMRRMRRFLGPGLLTYHGDEWRRQRRLIQRGFTPRSLQALAGDMRASLAQSLADLDTRLKAPVDLGAEMTTVTFAMVARSLFGAAMTPQEIALISDAILRIQAFIVRQITEPHLGPWFVASGARAVHDRLRQAGDDVLRRHIKARRASGEPGDDLLGVLISAQDAETGEGLSDEELLCECMQLLVAGHETSSNALAWTLYLLERDPQALARVRSEFQSVVGDRAMGWDDVANLPTASRVIEEALRLYPPFWMIDREAVQDDEAGGSRIAAGETIIAFLYGVHRDADRWPEPDAFQSDRLALLDRKTIRDFTYLPFGGGPRGCIGANYAMMQMLMVLETWTRRYDWSIEEGREVQPAPLIILRQQSGVSTRICRRDGASVEQAT